MSRQLKWQFEHRYRKKYEYVKQPLLILQQKYLSTKKNSRYWNKPDILHELAYRRLVPLTGYIQARKLFSAARDCTVGKTKVAGHTGWFVTR